MSEARRQIFAAVFVVAWCAGVWWFIQWRSAAPPPPSAPPPGQNAR